MLALALLWSLDFVSIQPNRIAPGDGLGLLAALGPGWALLLTGLLLACALLALRRELRSMMASWRWYLMVCSWMMPSNLLRISKMRRNMLTSCSSSRGSVLPVLSGEMMC